MLKRIFFIGFLALPGSFVFVSLVCVHPRSRAVLAELAYGPQLFTFVRRHTAGWPRFRWSSIATSVGERRIVSGSVNHETQTD